MFCGCKLVCGCKLDFSFSVKPFFSEFQREFAMKHCRAKPIINQYDEYSEIDNIHSFASNISDEYNTEDNISLPNLIMQLSNMDENILLANHGYRKQQTICNTSQGELFIVDIINNDTIKTKTAVIKKIDKLLHKQHIIIQNEINFITNKNIVQEIEILRHLTVENTNEHVVQYMESFESETHYYLVMEYIKSNMNLKEYVVKAQEYI
eukprot:379727_1